MAASLRTMLRQLKYSGNSSPRFLHQSSTSPALTTPTLAQTPADIRKMLESPSWSTASLLGGNVDAAATTTEPAITQNQLHHLLRLSALPLPKTNAEEAKMIKDLEAQLRFVQAIQKLDTEGVEPLQCIRDETEQGERESMITVESLRKEFDKEVVLGKRGRIIRRKDLPQIEAEDMGGWDPLAQAPKKFGRYFVVETDKD
ncbi:hypothetical protein MMC31_002083 [Peltigera leucophlebia]|nr:hypothetical protein [Peltigera leucophlebia]